VGRKVHNIKESRQFFTKINHRLCKHNAKQNLQMSSPRTALKWSRP